MPDVPRDPRQLARDILSGKIKIEDLARERQARQGTPANLRSPAVPTARVPNKVPLPRPASPASRAPMPQARPPLRPIPPRPQQPPPGFPQRPVPQRPVVRTVLPPPVRPPIPTTVTQASPAVPSTSTRSAAAREAKPGVGLGALLRSRRAVRQGIILSEILGKPLSLRDE